MRTEAGREQIRSRIGNAWFVLEATYLVAISALAVLGVTSDQRRILLIVAAVLTLPCGLGAMVGLYMFTGLFNWIAAGFSNTSTSQGAGGCNVAGHCWSITTGTPVGAQGFLFDACIVLLYLVAAVANVLILRALVRHRQNHRSATEPSI